MICGVNRAMRSCGEIFSPAEIGVIKVSNNAVYRRMRDNLEKNGVEGIVIPHKWLYHIPGLPDDICDGNYMVFAERVERVQNALLSLAQLG